MPSDSFCSHYPIALKANEKQAVCYMKIIKNRPITAIGSVELEMRFSLRVKKLSNLLCQADFISMITSKVRKKEPAKFRGQARSDRCGATALMGLAFFAYFFSRCKKVLRLLRRPSRHEAKHNYLLGFWVQHYLF